MRGVGEVDPRQRLCELAADGFEERELGGRGILVEAEDQDAEAVVGDLQGNGHEPVGRQRGLVHVRVALDRVGLGRAADRGPLPERHGPGHAVAFDRQHLHEHLLAFLQLVAHILDAMVRDLGDVQQAVGARHDLDERAEIGDPCDLAEVGLVELGRRREVADDRQRLRRRRLIARRHVHAAVVLHVDLHAGPLDDAADHLAARPDHVANLVDRDLHRVEARRVIGNLLAPGW